MKKFAIKSVVVAVGALSAMAAQAQVNIDATTITPVTVANEIIASTGTPVTLVNNANALSIQSTTGYALSNGEVRYVRVELANGTFNSAAVTLSSANSSVGAVNGVGTAVIYFSITAGVGGIAATDTVVINGDRNITGTASNITVSYSLYDQPSQAQAGGTTGRIVDKANRTYVNFAKSHRLVVTADSAVSNVEASPAFTRFVSQAATSSTAIARLAQLNYALIATAPVKADGNAVTLADLMAVGTSGTKLAITGDFSAAANTNGTYTGAALNRVYLSADTNCVAVSLAATTVTATAATFNVGATATTANQNLCYAPLSTRTIPAATYTADLNAVSAAPTVYAVASTAGGTASTITRNGTELQAPLFQTTAGFVSRFFLTNTGSAVANYSISVLTETGNTATTGTLTGTIPANGSVEIPAGTVVTAFTGATRGAAVFTVDRPTSQIQGVYQIVNQTSGAVSNMGMLRPGTN
jgi:hypothetical protein